VAVVVAAALDLLAALVPQDLPLAGSASLARALAAALQHPGRPAVARPALRWRSRLFQPLKPALRSTFRSRQLTPVADRWPACPYERLASD